MRRRYSRSSGADNILGFIGIFVLIGFIYHLCWVGYELVISEDDLTNKELVLSITGTIIPPIGIFHGWYEIFVE